MNNSDHRIARPGDIFLLLVPSARELHRLSAWQAKLQSRFGGRIVPDPHITCQRFSPTQGLSQDDCLQNLAGELGSIRSFPIYTDRLIQFHAPYWQTQVLRWRIQETDEYAEFRDHLEITLHRIQCPSHFNRLRHATCTALELEQPAELPGEIATAGLPAILFTASTLLVSELLDSFEFAILQTLRFRGN